MNELDWKLLEDKAPMDSLRISGAEVGETTGCGCGQGRAVNPAHGGLDRLQIRTAVFMALSKDTAEELVYFSPHLLMDSSSRFFSASVQPPRACSTGRCSQIPSLRVTSSALSFWKR